MNRKQMIVIWTMALSLAVVSVGYALQLPHSRYFLFSRLCFGLGVPIILIGSALIFQFGDTEAPKIPRIGESTLAFLIVVALFVQLAFIHQKTTSLQSDINGIQGTVDTLETSVDSIQMGISSLENDFQDVMQYFKR